MAWKREKLRDNMINIGTTDVVVERSFLLCTVPVPTQLDKVRWARGMDIMMDVGRNGRQEGHSTHRRGTLLS